VVETVACWAADVDVSVAEVVVEPVPLVCVVDGGASEAVVWSDFSPATPTPAAKSMTPAAHEVASA